MEKYNHEVLSRMKVKELLEIAKELHVVGRWNMVKSKLIECILACQSQVSFVGVHSSRKVDVVIDNIVTVKPDKNMCDDSRRKASANFLKLLSDLKPGVIVAFRKGYCVDDTYYKKMESGKVSEIDGDLLIIETKNGVKYECERSGVLWIKNRMVENPRWPQFIFAELKSNPTVITLEEYSAPLLAKKIEEVESVTG